MPYCQTKFMAIRNELIVVSPTGTLIVVPAERLSGDLRWLADPIHDMLYRRSELTLNQMQQLLDDADEIKPGDGVDLDSIKRRTLEERVADGELIVVDHCYLCAARISHGTCEP